MDNPMSAWEQIALLLPENGRHGKPWQAHSWAKVPRPGLCKQRGLSYWVLVVPTPRVATRLLEQHGGPLAEEHVRS